MNKEDYSAILLEISRSKATKHKQFVHEVVFKKAISIILAEKLAYDFFRLKSPFRKGEIIF